MCILRPHAASPRAPQDASRALAWFRKAAAKQAPLGLYGLGYMHLAGAW
jgi:TPR repeat protein